MNLKSPKTIAVLLFVVILISGIGYFLFQNVGLSNEKQSLKTSNDSNAEQNNLSKITDPLAEDKKSNDTLETINGIILNYSFKAPASWSNNPVFSRKYGSSDRGGYTCENEEISFQNGVNISIGRIIDNCFGAAGGFVEYTELLKLANGEEITLNISEIFSQEGFDYRHVHVEHSGAIRESFNGSRYVGLRINYVLRVSDKTDINSSEVLNELKSLIRTIDLSKV